MGHYTDELIQDTKLVKGLSYRSDWCKSLSIITKKSGLYKPKRKIIKSVENLTTDYRELKINALDY